MAWLNHFKRPENYAIIVIRWSILSVLMGIIGGLLGILFRWIHIQLVPDDHFSLWLVLLTCAATFALIILCQIFRPEGVHPGCIILIIVMYNNHFEAYYVYALNNILDTVIGVTFAMGVSWVFPRGWRQIWPERLRRWHVAIDR